MAGAPLETHPVCRPARDLDLRALLDRVAGGDQVAREQLVARFYPRVKLLVHRALQRGFRQRHRWIKPLFSTCDVVHEVFQQVLDEVECFDGDSEEMFVRYLSTIVSHRLLDAVRYHEAQRRDRRRQVQVGTTSYEGASAAPEPSPSRVAAVAEHFRLFREAVAGFPPRHALLLEMRLVDGESFARCAAVLGYPTADAARKAFHLAKARLALDLRRRGLRLLNQDALRAD